MMLRHRCKDARFDELYESGTGRLCFRILLLPRGQASSGAQPTPAQQATIELSPHEEAKHQSRRET